MFVIESRLRASNRWLPFTKLCSVGIWRQPPTCFRMRCWYRVGKASRSKGFPQICEECISEYFSDTTGYKLLDFEKHKVVISRNVQFDEHGEARKASLFQEKMIRVEGTQLNWCQTEPIKKLMKIWWRANRNLVNILTKEASPINDLKRQRSHGMWRVPDINEPPASLLFPAPTGLIAWNQAVEGLDAQKWARAMDTEYHSLLENQTWEAVKHHVDQKLYSTRVDLQTKEG